MTDEPWQLRTTPTAARAIPEDILERLHTQPDVVEELSDGLRLRFNIESGLDFGEFAVQRAGARHVGTIVTVRYVPKMVPDNDQRLGHNEIAAALPPGAIVVVTARGCQGSVLGGVGAATIRAAQANAVIIDGIVRDIPEIMETGLALVGRRLGITSGRPSTQAAEIGGQIVVAQHVVRSGDIGVMNQYGMVCIPSWLPWDAVREILSV